jgi:hypothetical protein
MFHSRDPSSVLPPSLSSPGWAPMQRKKPWAVAGWPSMRGREILPSSWRKPLSSVVSNATSRRASIFGLHEPWITSIVGEPAFGIGADDAPEGAAVIAAGATSARNAATEFGARSG